MAHFYGSMSGQGNQVTRPGAKNSGIQAHVRGWNVGVEVRGFVNDEGKDEFLVYATSGSNGAINPTLIGTVYTDEDTGEPRIGSYLKGYEPAAA